MAERLPSNGSGNGAEEGSFERAFIPLEWINVLPQPRKTFDTEKIKALANNLSAIGFLNLPIVARFTRKGCARFLEFSNIEWRTEFTLGDLSRVKDDNGQAYYVLIAGERRFRAVHYLWDHGCDECVKAHGSRLRSGQCFRKHFGRRGIEVTVGHDINPLSVKWIQFAENTHEAVPSHEEAGAYGRFYRVFQQEAGTTLAQFARNVGRSPDTVRGAIWYCCLPVVIQGMVEEGTLAYGIAIQLARLQERGGLEEQALMRWAQVAISHSMKVPDFKARVDQYLEDQQSGQLAMDVMMGEAALKADFQASVRRAIESRSLQGIYAFFRYFTRVAELFESGVLRRADSPFSVMSTLRMFRKLLLALERVYPHLCTLLPQETRERAPVIIGANRWATDELIRELEEEGDEGED